MNPRKLAALLSSLISQALLLLLLLFPSPKPFSFLTILSTPPPDDFLLLLLHHHLVFTSEIATSLAVLPSSRKRKRTHILNSRFSDDENVPSSGEGMCESGGHGGLVLRRSPDLYKQFFRMNSSTFEWLCGLLEPLLDCRDPAGSPLNLPAETRLGIGLFRLATGSDYPEISNRFRVSELVSRFCVKQLCRVLCTNYRFWVGFPSENDLFAVSNQFETISGLPNCCGIIDCTRFKIITNQGSSDTIAAQIVVDASSKILSIAAGSRGDKNESTILKLSTLYTDFENRVLLNSGTISQYFVGGQQYPFLPWLMVPFIDPIEGSREANFNYALKSMYFPIVKAVRSLRNWGILSSPINADFKESVAYVGTCSILHNMLLSREDFSAFCNETIDSAVYAQESCCHSEDNSNEKASAVRNALTARLVAAQ